MRLPLWATAEALQLSGDPSRSTMWLTPRSSISTSTALIDRIWRATQWGYMAIELARRGRATSACALSPVRERLPQAIFKVLPEVGHAPMYDDPDLVARTILGTTGTANS